jgi:hypothetical protein
MWLDEWALNSVGRELERGIDPGGRILKMWWMW